MIEIFDKQKHGEMIERWLGARNMAVPGGFLPPNGLVVNNIAAVFLNLTDGPWAFMSDGVSDPAAPKEARRHALRIAGNQLEKCAAAHGKKVMFTWSTLRSMSEHAKGMNYVTGETVTMYYKVLEGNIL